MEKIVLNNSERTLSKIIYNGSEIFIQPYITLSQEKTFIDNYVASLYSSDNYTDNLIQAEFGLVLNIFDALTNLEVISPDNKIIQIDDLIYGDLWVKVQNEIKNFDDFKYDLARVLKLVENQRNLDKSVGVVLDSVAQKFYETLDKISKMDFSEEGIKTLVTELQTNLTKLNQDWGKTK